MEAIQQRLSQLTVDELRAQLTSCGQKPIPITKTTRALVERRIAKYLWEQQGGGGQEEDSSEHDPSDAKTKSIATDGTTAKPVQEPKSAAASDQGETSKSQADLEALRNKKNAPTEMSGEVAMTYFAVCIPPKNEPSSSGGDDQVDSSSVTGNSDEILIYQDRREALFIAKKNKGARFKVFKTKEEAENFAKSHQDLITPKPSTEPTSSQPIAEKPVSSFRSVKPQDLVALRKTIETNDLAKFKELVWSNPRYLINAGDTPTILQEGSRYNALHIVAKENRAEICRLLLGTIQDAAYILLMYPDDPEDTIVSRREYLTDLYLNSPDKGNGETPLHFAAKFGSVEVTEILVNHPQCDKKLKNKFGQTAQEIICSWSRCSLSGRTLQQLEATIADLLQDHYYVPVYRSEDNCTPPVIGEPWSPDLSDHQSSPLFHIRPAASESPIDAVLSLQAYAGPMSPAEAECFRRNLQTPPSTERKRVGRIKRADEEKGVERIGREVAGKMQVSWAEYWGFLDAFVDMASPEGLQKFEEYLAKRCTIGRDEADLASHVPAVKQGTVSSAQTGEVIKDLVGDFEQLTISDAENDGALRDGAKEVRHTDKKGMNCTESNVERMKGEVEKTRTTKCEEDRSGSLVLEISSILDSTSEKLNVDGSADGAVNCPESNVTLEEGALVEKQTVTCNHDGPTTLVDVNKIANDCSGEATPNRQLTDCASGVSEGMKSTSTSPNVPERAPAEQHLSREDSKQSDLDSNKGSVDSLKDVGKSEILHQAKGAPHIDGIMEGKIDNDACSDGETQLRDGAILQACAQEGNTSTIRIHGRKTGQTHLSTDGHSTPKGCRVPPSAVKQETSPSLGIENPASSDWENNREGTVPSVSGNGDRKAEVFKTPKAFSSRKFDGSVLTGGREKVGYILGSQPTKADLHVWRALAEVQIPDGYPCIQQWKQLVTSVPSEKRDKWPTPARCKPTRVARFPPSQTPSPHRLSTLLDGSPLALRARHFSEPTHHFREPAGGFRLQQARFDRAESLGEPKARLFQE